MGYDQLPLAQKTVGYVDGFLHQTARVVAKIQNQALNVALGETRQRLIHFMAGGFVEGLDLHVGDSLADPERLVHAATRNVVANEREVNRLGDCSSRRTVMVTGVPFGPFNMLETCDTVERSVLMSFTGDDLVARAQTGSKRRRSFKRVHHDDAAFRANPRTSQCRNSGRTGPHASTGMPWDRKNWNADPRCAAWSESRR